MAVLVGFYFKDFIIKNNLFGISFHMSLLRILFSPVQVKNKSLFKENSFLVSVSFPEI